MEKKAKFGKGYLPVCLFVFVSFLTLSTLNASAQGLPWRYNAAPFDFTFGNHIDTHQQSRIQRDGDLIGFLYITYTGEFNEAGVPIAQHCDETTAPDDCVVGWRFRGKPGVATFLYHTGDHPVWLVHSRSDIPQPGAYAHFHWLGEPETAGELEPNDLHDGYFLELFALRKFVFLHHEEEIPVTPGIDIATHVNIVSSFPDSHSEHTE